MKFVVPIRYRVTGIKVGNSVRSRSEIGDFHEVEIPELDERLAPVLVEWRADERDLQSHAEAHRCGAINAPDLRVSYPADGMCHIRRVGDKFWKPIMHFTNGSFSTRPGGMGTFLSTEMLTDLLSHRRKPGLFWDAGRATRAGAKRHDEDGHALFSDIAESGRRLARLEAEAQAAEYTIVDDLVYTRCPEPMVAVMVVSQRAGFPGGRNVAFLRVTCDLYDIERSGASLYHLEHADRALDMAESVNARRGGEVFLRAFNRERMPKIVNPMEYDPWNAWKHASRRHVARLRERLDEVATGKLSDRTLSAIADLRRAGKMAEGEERLRAVETALLELREGLGELHLGVETEIALESVEAALSALAERPVFADGVPSPIRLAS
jgi:hypothetical protein